MKPGNYHLWMLIGCTLPFFLVFLAPLLGISGNVSFFVFIIVMFGCHLMMTRRHPGHGQEQKENNDMYRH